MQNLTNNKQIQERIEYLKQNPKILIGAVAGAGALGLAVLLRARGSSKNDGLTEAVAHGDLDDIVREAARQGFEAGRAAEQAAHSKGPVQILGFSPAEILSLVGIATTLARQVSAMVREQQDTGTRTAVRM